MLLKLCWANDHAFIEFDWFGLFGFFHFQSFKNSYWKHSWILQQYQVAMKILVFILMSLFLAFSQLISVTGHTWNRADVEPICKCFYALPCWEAGSVNWKKLSVNWVKHNREGEKKSSLKIRKVLVNAHFEICSGPCK